MDLCDVTDQFLTAPLNTDQLRKDLNEAMTQHEFTSKSFGGWSSIPLRSLNGVTGSEGSRASGKHASSDATLFKDTVVMPDYIRSVINDAARGSGGVLKARLMRLQANRTIGEHRDKFTPGPPVLRLHIPIVTNPEVIFLVNRKPYHMEEGRLYSIDVSMLHAVSNKGTLHRVHLVFDVVMTPEVKEKMKAALPPP